MALNGAKVVNNFRLQSTETARGSAFRVINDMDVLIERSKAAVAESQALREQCAVLRGSQAKLTERVLTRELVEHIRQRLANKVEDTYASRHIAQESGAIESIVHRYTR